MPIADSAQVREQELEAAARRWARRRPARRRRDRLCALIIGALCIPGYLLLPGGLDPAAGAAGALARFVEELPFTSWDGTILSFLATFFRNALAGFSTTYIRILIWMLPALALMTWGLAGLVSSGVIDAVLAAAARRAFILAGGAAVFAAVFTHLISARVLEHHPITQGDEFSYRFHARLFASGRLYAEPPPAGESFRNRAFVCGSRWHGIGFGGHPLALSVGELLGSIYLIPALFAGLSVLLTFLFVQEVFDRGSGLLAAALLALSPLFIFYHATLLPESTNLVLLLAFLLLLARAGKRGRALLACGAAVCLALAVFTRPQTTCVFSVPVGLWLLCRRNLSLRARIRPAAILLAGAGAGVIGLFAYAHLVSGRPFGQHLSPGYHHDEVGGAWALGIEDLCEFVGSSLHTVVTLVKMNFLLLGWPVSLAALYLWLRKPAKGPWDYLLFSCVAVIFWFYWMYPAQHEQYFVEAGQLMVVLGATGLVSAHRRAKAGPRAGRQDRAVACFVLMSYVLGAASVWPFRVAYFTERSAPERAVWQPIRAARLHNAIVFLEDLPNEFINCVGANSPDLDDDVLLAKVRNRSEIPSIARHFPDRAGYRMFRESADGPLQLARYPDHGSAAESGGAGEPEQGAEQPGRLAGIGAGSH